MKTFLVIFLALCALSTASKIVEKRHSDPYHSGFNGGFGSGFAPSDFLAPPTGPIVPTKHVGFNGLNQHLPTVNTYIEPTKIITKVIKYPVPVPHPVPVPVKHAVPVPHPVPVEIKKPYPVPVPHPVPVYINKPFPVNVNKPVPVYIKQYIPVPVTVEHHTTGSAASQSFSNSFGFQGNQGFSDPSYANAFAHTGASSSGSSGYSYERPAKTW